MKVSRVHTLIIFSIALDSCQCRTYGQQPQGSAGKITVAVVQSKSATLEQSYPCWVDSVGRVFVHSPVKGRVTAILVKEGQAVTKGQKIGEMGDTDADQVKLHFEIRRLGKPIDPVKMLPPA